MLGAFKGKHPEIFLCVQVLFRVFIRAKYTHIFYFFFCFRFKGLMPWPGLPPALSLTGRTRRHVQSPVATPLNYIMSHPLNMDRPAVTSLGQKLDRDEFEKVMSGFSFKDEMSLDYIFYVSFRIYRHFL